MRAERRRTLQRRYAGWAAHLEPSNLAGVLGGLPLAVVEVRGHSHHRMAHRPAEVALRRLLHLAEDEGAGLRGRVLRALDLAVSVAVARLHDLVRHVLQVLLHVLVVEPAPDQALGRKERALRVRDTLPLGRRAHQALAVVREADDGRRRARALSVLNHLGTAPLHHRHARVGGAKVDANDISDGRTAQSTGRHLSP